MGLGLAAAVLIDATVIRGVMLPAAMKLLGDWNWYLPSWLEWLPHPGGEGDMPDGPPEPSEVEEPEPALAERVLDRAEEERPAPLPVSRGPDTAGATPPPAGRRARPAPAGVSRGLSRGPAS
jgi:hypothetical protein